MLDKQQEKSAFYRRLRLYGIGVGMGCVMVYFMLWKGKDVTSWTPENRLHDKFRHSTITYSEKANCLLECLNVTKEEVKRSLDSTGTMDILVRDQKCPVYSMTSGDIEITVTSCETTATITDIKRLNSENKCLCK